MTGLPTPRETHAKRDFAAQWSRSPLEEPLEVGPVNDETLARHSG